mmetsp:Transcript_34856/g.74300  ORF Transcript_34856/g.74300 Transcript_34856/m.74300 type:complete len:110 (+) Transcript_34856:1110-1439(+)
MRREMPSVQGLGIQTSRFGHDQYPTLFVGCRPQSYSTSAPNAYTSYFLFNTCFCVSGGKSKIHDVVTWMVTTLCINGSSVVKIVREIFLFSVCHQRDLVKSLAPFAGWR